MSRSYTPLPTSASMACSLTALFVMYRNITYTQMNWGGGGRMDGRMDGQTGVCSIR
jgi:hypothetical protein